jgi:dihydroorotate dehydrogenase (NAD+) catalytic subunit
VRAATKLPVWVKMSPEAGDLVGVARACEAEGADAITAINTIRGMVIDVEKMQPKLKNRTGGLSGPALRPVAVRMVYDLVGALSIPVVGIGGISCARDALEFLLAGAKAVQIGTANFKDPAAAKRIADGIASFAEQRQLSVEELIGKARV